MSKKLTVIVPVYNVEPFLSKCLDSLLSQTYRDIDIICINDGSTDGSANILKEYAKKDNRITIVTKANGGLSSARNEGLKKCKSDFVMFCDSDDYVDPRICERMLNAIESSGSDLATCVQKVIYQAHEEMRFSDYEYYRLKYMGKQTINDSLILNTDVSVLNKIFRMSIINKNGINFPDKLNNEDFYFCNAYMSVSHSIYFVEDELYNYVRREGSIMSENFEAKKLSMDHLLVTEKLFDFYNKTSYIKKHTNLFWRQWMASYWFSIEHSSVQYRQKIAERASQFVQDNLSKWTPDDKSIQYEINNIFTKDNFRMKKVLKKIKNKSKHTLLSLYSKVNVGYSQRKYINRALEDLINKHEILLTKIERLNKNTKHE